MRELTALGLWDNDVKQHMLLSKGSVQGLKNIPSQLKNIYKTVWEIPQRVIIEQAADRAPFVCQSQSMNIFVESPSRGKLTSMLFHSWKRKLVTGMYYLRSRPKSDPVQFGVSGVSCSRLNKDCEACSA